MRWLIVFAIVSCVSMPKPLPEDMPQGREICKALCASYARDYLEYRYDGKCVCGPAK